MRIIRGLIAYYIVAMLAMIIGGGIIALIL